MSARPLRILAILALYAGCTPAATGWSMFRGDPTHTGDFGTRRSLRWQLRWSQELGERIDASALVTPDGEILVVTRAGSVTVLEPDTGNIARHGRLPAGVWASPGLAAGVVVLAGEDGLIHGLDLGSLVERWHVAASAKSFSAMTVLGHDVFFMSGDALLGLDARDGRVIFRVEIGAPSYTAPVWDERAGHFVVGTRDGQVVAVTREPPAVRWRAVTTQGQANDGSAVIAGDLVLLGSNDKALHAFKSADGAAAWTAAADNWVVSTPAVRGDLVIFGDDSGVVHAVGLGDGKERWRGQVGDDLASSPTLVGGLVVFGAHDGKAHARDALTGVARPDIDAGGVIYASPAVAEDGAVILSTQQGRVLCIQ